MEKLYRKLESLADTGNYPFHMPGHKRNPESVDSDFLLKKTLRRFPVLMTFIIPGRF